MLEQPKMGDVMRLTPSVFSAICRNKRSITVNLRSEKGKEICHKLAERSDVFTEAFRVGTVARLGIDYENIRAINPGLIYVSMTAFGQGGPYKERVAHDLSLQGLAGMLATQISPARGNFVPSDVLISDFSSAMFATIAILAALRTRDQTGKGQYIDISAADGLVSWMSMYLAEYFQIGKISPTRWEPAFGVFETRDGKFLTLSIFFEDAFWRSLCKVINREDLSGLSHQDRLEKREELVSLLKEAILGKNRDEWVQILADANVPSGPAYMLAEVPNDQHFQHRGMFPEIGKIKHVANPMKFSETSLSIRMRAPKLGEHNEEILLSLGYNAKEIEEMRKEGVI
jgi:crotonobetainyl-CoA:carnitine CoA-transferase CaiB-like acyl-CoA transferase